MTIPANHPPTRRRRQLTTAEDAPGRARAGRRRTRTATRSASGSPSSPDHGTLAGTAPNLTYTPAPDFNGTDSFRFTANDGEDESAPATVGITVSEVNDSPSAQPDSITGGVGQTVAVAAATLAGERRRRAVRRARSDAPRHRRDGDRRHARDGHARRRGRHLRARCRLHRHGDGALHRLRQRDDERPGRPACAEGRALDRGQPGADGHGPVGVDAAQHAADDHPRGNDPEDDVLTFAVASAARPRDAHRHRADTLRLHAGRRVRRRRLVHVHRRRRLQHVGAGDGVDRRRRDAAADRSGPTLSPPPTNTSVLVDVLANDTAAAGSLDPATLAVVVAADERHRGRRRPAIRYTPAPGVTPADRFTYRVCDTFGVCGQAEVTVSVGRAEPSARGEGRQLRGRLGATLDVAAPGLLANDTDPDPGDAIQARLGTGVVAGNLLLRFDGSFRYTPSPGFAGSRQLHVLRRRPRGPRVLAGHGHDRRRSRPARSPSTTRYATTSDNPLTVMPAGVLANDRDAHSTDVLTARLDRPAVPRQRRPQPRRLVRLHPGPRLRRHRHLPLRRHGRPGRGRRPRPS